MQTGGKPDQKQEVAKKSEETELEINFRKTMEIIYGKEAANQFLSNTPVDNPQTHTLFVRLLLPQLLQEYEKVYAHSKQMFYELGRKEKELQDQHHAHQWDKHQFEQFREQTEDLPEKNKQLEKDNESLRQENQSAKDELIRAKEQIKELKERNKELKQKNKDLDSALTDAMDQISELEEQQASDTEPEEAPKGIIHHAEDRKASPASQGSNTSPSSQDIVSPDSQATTPGSQSDVVSLDSANRDLAESRTPGSGLFRPPSSPAIQGQGVTNQRGQSISRDAKKQPDKSVRPQHQHKSKS